MRQFAEIANGLPDGSSYASEGYLRYWWDSFFKLCTPEEKAFWLPWSRV
jgi:hypothetical protein